ncbi:PQQ-binding-like beta-propeller repeat protein [bacterium]|jgi:outer membrane protein assembly factor BamB|nr:PQQ-binding-like beta-propeller repeat protein [bacterium]
MKRCDVMTTLVLLASASVGWADHWPTWRGPSGDGISTETGLATTWDGPKSARWRLELPGPGGSTPVIWGDKIFLTSADKGNLVLLAADTNGKLLWKEVVSSGDQPVRGDEGNMASPSPVTDGKHVWAMFGNAKLTCRDFTGKDVWTVDLQERYGKFDIAFGVTSTPILHGDHLYLQCMYTGASYILCLDSKTGKEIWKHDRPSDAIEECEHSYASPFLYRDAKHEYLLAHGADYISAHQLSDGAEIFRCGGLNGKEKAYNPTLRFVSSPVGGEGLIVVPSAKKGPVLGLSPEAKGNITATDEGHLWRLPNNTPDVPSPLIHEGIVYLCSEDGVLTTLDAKTGKQIYRERIEPGRYRASPLFADGKIYFVSRKGTVYVVQAGREFKLLAKNAMDEEVSSSLAVADGIIYVRTFNALYAVGK